MSPSIWLNYRPVKIGWVIGEQNPELLVHAAQLSICIWGGKFNPIIPAYDPDLAENLIRVFRVDMLHPLDESDATMELVKKHADYLIRGAIDKEIFHVNSEKFCRYADIYHPARKLLQEKPEAPSLAQIGWSENDPLKHLFSLTFGSYPSPDKTGNDYSAIYGGLSPENQVIVDNEPISKWILDFITPVNFSSFYLTRYGGSNSWLTPGIMIGDIANSDDLLKFWNFRAAGAPLLFYDPAHHDRLKPLIEFQALKVREHSRDPEKPFYVWSHKKDESIKSLDLEGVQIFRCGIDHTWNGLNMKPVHIYLNEDHHDVVSNYSEHNRTRTATFSLPEKPFYKEIPHAHMQNFIVSVRSFSSELSDEYTFNTPFIPKLNEFYGRNFYGSYDNARSERDYMDEHTLGIIANITSQRESIHAIDVQKFWKELFSLVGLEYERNEPGHRCANLIRQLGGLQGCRVLKIPGLRKLIHKYSQDQSFTQAAQQIILDRNEETGASSFTTHEDLYIEYRPHGGKLKPQQVFTYMVKHGLFRVGLDIKCTECFLSSWIHLDEVKTFCKCDYCGNEFNITPFLRDRDWRYRRSGVLGLPKDKLDSIAVALTLQQLDTCFRDGIMYSTSANLVSKNPNVEDCEADFLLMLKCREHNGETPVQFLIGECKSEGGVIEEEDVRKLGKLAAELEENIGQAYIMFSKTGQFSEDEINIIKTLNSEHKLRAIIWSPDELEPYHVYERADEGSIPHKYAFSLSHLARNTKSLFLS